MAFPFQNKRSSTTRKRRPAGSTLQLPSIARDLPAVRPFGPPILTLAFWDPFADELTLTFDRDVHWNGVENQAIQVYDVYLGNRSMLAAPNSQPTPRSLLYARDESTGEQDFPHKIIAGDDTGILSARDTPWLGGTFDYRSLFTVRKFILDSLADGFLYFTNALQNIDPRFEDRNVTLRAQPENVHTPCILTTPNTPYIYTLEFNAIPTAPAGAAETALDFSDPAFADLYDVYGNRLDNSVLVVDPVLERA